MVFLMNDGLKDKPDRVNNKGKSDKNPAYKKREIKPPKKITQKYLYNSGLAYLQRHIASSHHFKSVMMRKINKSCRHHTEQDMDECEALLDVVIQQFQKMMILDDAAYLKGMVTSFRRRGLSRSQITYKLGQKGFSHEAVTQELNTHDSDEYRIEDNENGDVYAALVFARKKKLGPYDPDNKKTPEKSLATMARAGYSYEIAKKTLDIAPDMLEELEDKFTRL